MRRIITFIISFMMLFMTTAQARYSAQEVYNCMERAFLWAQENASPLGSGDNVASDYYVMALSRANRSFDYNKYKKITLSRTPNTTRDAHRIIMANAASDGYFNETFVADYTYGKRYTSVSELSSAILSIGACDYSVNSKDTSIDEMVARLLSYQATDGSFGNNVYTTCEAILALSRFEGNRYALVGEYKTEKYYYDVNTQMLRAVSYLQGAKGADCGYTSVKNTAMVIMALDSIGIDADNDPGFSRDGKSPLQWLMSKDTGDGKFSDIPDENALGVCALVSHIRAMEGKEDFYKLRGYDKISNPSIYTDDINLSGIGFTQDGSDKKTIEVTFKEGDVATQAPTNAPFYDDLPPVTIEEDEPIEKKRLAPMLLLIFLILALAGIICGFILWRIGIKPKFIKSKKKRK